MFDQLSQRFQSLLKNLSGQGKISEKNILDSLREVRLALLEADVHYQVVKDFLDKVKEQALGQAVWDSLDPGQQFISIVNEEMTRLLGANRIELHLASQSPTVIMLVGLQGSGKTTTCAKLALYFKQKKDKKTQLVSMDLKRLAAQEQLKILSNEIGMPFAEGLGRTPLEVAARAREAAEASASDILIVDTAGRLHIDEELMAELKQAKEKIKPHYVLLVVDAMTGQDAVNQAKAFQEIVGLDGVILTKLDGDMRGGAALSVVSVAKVPILFVGMGEKLENLEPFYPERMAGRILNKGDILSLVEKAQEVMDTNEAQELQKKLRKNVFTLNDFLKQIRQVRKMGSLSSVLGMIPGLSGKLPDMDDEKTEKQFKKIEAMICSMTREERENPDVINGSRRQRIAQGSGSTVEELNRFMKQFFESKKMIKKFQQKGKGSFLGKGLFS